MNTPTFVKSGHDKFGYYHILWRTGNYQYEIEDRTNGMKLKFDDEYYRALRLFEEVLVSY